MPPLRYFNRTFTLPNLTLPCRATGSKCAPLEYHFQGYTPPAADGEGPWPLYLFTDGAGPWFNDIRNQAFEDAPELQFIGAMARRTRDPSLDMFDGCSLNPPREPKRARVPFLGTRSATENARGAFGRRDGRAPAGGIDHAAL